MEPAHLQKVLPRPGNVNHVGDGVIVGTQAGSPGTQTNHGRHWQCFCTVLPDQSSFKTPGFYLFHVFPYVSLDVLLNEVSTQVVFLCVSLESEGNIKTFHTVAASVLETGQLALHWKPGLRTACGIWSHWTSCSPHPWLSKQRRGATGGLKARSWTL